MLSDDFPRDGLGLSMARAMLGETGSVTVPLRSRCGVCGAKTVATGVAGENASSGRLALAVSDRYAG